MKGIYTALTGLLAMTAVAAQATPSQANDARLQQELNSFAQSHKIQPKSTPDWHVTAQSLAQLSRQNRSLVAAPATGCADASNQEIDGRYVMTFDANNQPCHIYDLSFPTVASIFGLQTVSKIPVQKFMSDDYLNWMHGNYSQVYTSVKTFNSNFKSAQAPLANQADWMKNVKFTGASLMRLKWSTGTSPAGLPNSFKASDLDLGSDFAFTTQERDELRQALQQMSGSGSGLVAANDPWSQMVENPNSILEHIRFNWNDLEKVYEVVMDGDFFPIVGPVALVDYGTPYKPAMQAMIRSMVESAVSRLVTGIGNVTNQRILQVALTDGFEFIEDIYSYQQNMMEMSLQNAAAQAGDASVMSTNASRGIDLIFATRTGFFTDYVTAMAQGQKFDWTKIELKGHQARYKEDKAREISMDKRNSELALKGGCTTTAYATYFATCAKAGKTTGVYSLLSDTSVLFWSFGAPMVYNPNMPSEVFMKRLTSRVLETGLRIVRLPILNFLTDMLADQLKSYAMAGADDEAFLHSTLLFEKHTHGSLDADAASQLKWMYLQNINPFMPKTETSENSTVDTNRGHAPAALMGN